MRVATEADIKIGQHVMIKYNDPKLKDDEVEGRHFYYMSHDPKVYQMGVIEALNGKYNQIETTMGYVGLASDLIIPTDEQIKDYELFMSFYEQYERLNPVEMEEMTADQECDYDGDCRIYATEKFIQLKRRTAPKQQMTEYAIEAEQLIQQHIAAGLTDAQAWKAAIITLEYYGCSLKGNSRIDSKKQKAYNYLTGVGKVIRKKL